MECTDTYTYRILIRRLSLTPYTENSTILRTVYLLYLIQTKTVSVFLSPNSQIIWHKMRKFYYDQ